MSERERDIAETGKNDNEVIRVERHIIQIIIKCIFHNVFQAVTNFSNFNDKILLN